MLHVSSIAVMNHEDQLSTMQLATLFFSLQSSKLYILVPKCSTDEIAYNRKSLWSVVAAGNCLCLYQNLESWCSTNKNNIHTFGDMQKDTFI